MNDPLQPHSHDNNLTPPDYDPTLILTIPGRDEVSISLVDLMVEYPESTIPAYQYMTDHGMHGPYRLDGVRLVDLIHAHLEPDRHYTSIEVVSADGFGNRIYPDEMLKETEHGPILLCYRSNGESLGRRHGLVRLVVPSETDNALRQIKWVRRIVVVTGER